MLGTNSVTKPSVQLQPTPETQGAPANAAQNQGPIAPQSVNPTPQAQETAQKVAETVPQPTTPPKDTTTVVLEGEPKAVAEGKKPEETEKVNQNVPPAPKKKSALRKFGKSLGSLITMLKDLPNTLKTTSKFDDAALDTKFRQPMKDASDTLKSLDDVEIQNLTDEDRRSLRIQIFDLLSSIQGAKEFAKKDKISAYAGTISRNQSEVSVLLLKLLSSNLVKALDEPIGGKKVISIQTKIEKLAEKLVEAEEAQDDVGQPENSNDSKTEEKEITDTQSKQPETTETSTDVHIPTETEVKKTEEADAASDVPTPPEAEVKTPEEAGTSSDVSTSSEEEVKKPEAAGTQANTEVGNSPEEANTHGETSVVDDNKSREEITSNDDVAAPVHKKKNPLQRALKAFGSSIKGVVDALADIPKSIKEQHEATALKKKFKEPLKKALNNLQELEKSDLATLTHEDKEIRTEIFKLLNSISQAIAYAEQNKNPAFAGTITRNESIAVEILQRLKNSNLVGALDKDQETTIKEEIEDIFAFFSKQTEAENSEVGDVDDTEGEGVSNDDIQTHQSDDTEEEASVDDTKNIQTHSTEEEPEDKEVLVNKIHLNRREQFLKQARHGYNQATGYVSKKVSDTCITKLSMATAAFGAALLATAAVNSLTGE